MKHDHGTQGLIQDAVKLADTPEKKNLALWYILHCIGKPLNKVQEPKNELEEIAYQLFLEADLDFKYEFCPNSQLWTLLLSHGPIEFCENWIDYDNEETSESSEDIYYD